MVHSTPVGMPPTVARVSPLSLGTRMVRSVSYWSPGQSRWTVKFWPAPAIGPTACLTMSSRPVSRRLVTVTTAGAVGSVPITTGFGVMSTSSQPSGGSSSVMVQVEPLAIPSITSNAAPRSPTSRSTVSLNPSEQSTSTANSVPAPRAAPSVTFWTTRAPCTRVLVMVTSDGSVPIVT